MLFENKSPIKAKKQLRACTLRINECCMAKTCCIQVSLALRVDPKNVVSLILDGVERTPLLIGDVISRVSMYHKEGPSAFNACTKQFASGGCLLLAYKVANTGAISNTHTAGGGQATFC